MSDDRKQPGQVIARCERCLPRRKCGRCWGRTSDLTRVRPQREYLMEVKRHFQAKDNRIEARIEDTLPAGCLTGVLAYILIWH